MDWALEWKNDQHELTRLHIKTAITMENGNILVVARGKPKSVTQQISGLLLEFKVEKDDKGKYKLEPITPVKRIFPSIFCRQLDHIKKVKEKIIITMDTADGDNFEAFSIDTTEGVYRSDNVCQKHSRHIFSEQIIN